MEQRSNNSLTSSLATKANTIISNIIPTIWYQIIKSKSGRSYDVAVLLLGEVYYWNQPSKFGSKKKFSGDFLNLRYSELATKFQKSKETIRRAFIRLEELGIIKRRINDIKYNNTFCANALFIEFFPKNLEKLCNDFSFDNKQLLPSDLKIQPGSKDNVIMNSNFSNYDNRSEDKKFSLPPQNVGMISSICGDVYREKKERIKANSLRLSFINFEEEKKEDLITKGFSETFDLVLKREVDLNLDPGIKLDTKLGFNKITSKFEQNLDTQEKEQSKPDLEITTEVSKLPQILQTPAETSKVRNKVQNSKSNYLSFNSYKKLPCYHFLPVSRELCYDLRAEIGEDYPDSYFEEAVIKMIEMDKTLLAARNSKSVGHGSTDTNSNLEKTSELVPVWSIRQVRSRLLAWSRREFKSLDEIKERLGLISGSEALEAGEVRMSQKKEESYDNALLSRYEDSKDTSPVGVIKRKIAGSLPRDIALILLKSSYLSIKNNDLSYSSDHSSYSLDSLNSPNDILSVKIRNNIHTVKDLKIQRIGELLEPLAKSVMGEGARVDITLANSLIKKSSNDCSSDIINQEILTDDRKRHLIEESFSKDDEVAKIQKSLLTQIGLNLYYSWFREVRFEFDDIGRNTADNNFNDLERPRKLMIVADGRFKRDYLRANYATQIRLATKSVLGANSVLNSSNITSLAGDENINNIVIEFVEESEISTKSVDKYVELSKDESVELELA